jgi:hypothetical protein
MMRRVLFTAMRRSMSTSNQTTTTNTSGNPYTWSYTLRIAALSFVLGASIEALMSYTSYFDQLRAAEAKRRVKKREEAAAAAAASDSQQSSPTSPPRPSK